MKFFFPVVFTVLFSNYVCATIFKGQIIAANSVFPKAVYLHCYYTQYKTDTLKVGMFGDFSFITTLKIPAVYELQLGRGAYSFFINPLEAKVHISLSIANNEIINGEVEDSKENNAYLNFDQVLKVYDNQLINLMSSSAVDTAFENFIVNYNKELDNFQHFYKGTYTSDTLARMRKIKTVNATTSALLNLRKNFFSNVNFADSSIIANPVVVGMVNLYASFLCDTFPAERNEFINNLMEKAKRNNNVYQYIANELFDSFLSGMQEEMMIFFMEWFRASADSALLPVLKAKTEKLSKSMPGQPIIELRLKNEKDKYESLSTTVLENKLTVLLFWESTCPHCRIVIPEVVKLYNAYHAKGLEVFAVSLEEEEGKWKQYLMENNIAWKNLIFHDSENTGLGDYFITSTPTFVLINQHGVILHRMMNMDRLLPMIERAFD